MRDRIRAGGIGPARWAFGELTLRGRRPAWKSFLLIAAVLGACWLLTYALGGAGRVPPHWFYVPILIAGARFGVLGAVTSAIAAGILAGPLMPADTATGAAQHLSDWAVRAGAFLVIGLVMSSIVRKLREAETKYRTLVEQLPAIVYTAEFGSDGTWRYVSPRIESMLGFSPEEWAADPELWFRQIHPEDRERALAEEGRSKASGEPLLSEYRLFTRTGRILWFRDEAVVLADDAGRPQSLQGVMYDITDRKRAEEEVRRLNEDLERRVIERTAQLEAASQAKSEFLSKMSHELRTPLNAVLGFGQVLEREDLEPDQLDSVRQILIGGRHLLDLINELLDIARIESGRISLAPEPVRVTDALSEVLDLVSPLAAERRVVLHSPPPDERWVEADPQRLKQVLLNLLSNAVKYNREGGSVIVALTERSAGLVTVSVSDQGPGIADGDLPRLFEPFERLEADRTGVQGTGLGLALCKHLVEAMGGSIEVRSEPGRGSTFSIELPLTERLADPAETSWMDEPAQPRR